MKPFDLEKAKLDHPVCTRDGRKARIICFDRKEVCPIIALVEDGGKETTHTYTRTGSFSPGFESPFDLMMNCEEKEGWINIYESSIGDTNRECRAIYNSKEDALKNRIERHYITTIKIEWEE